MSNSNQPPKNVIDMGRHRRSQRTLQGASAGTPRLGPKPKKFVTGGKNARLKTIWNYVQFFLFLGVVAYIMQICRAA